MRDKVLFAMLIAELQALRVPRGLPDALYATLYQPTQQGRPEGVTIWMHKSGDKRYGSRTTNQVPGPGPTGMLRREVQTMESTIRFSVTQPPAIEDSDLTHADVLKAIASAAQCPDFIDALRAYNASVLRVTEIANTPYINDTGQWEEGPMFSLVVRHLDIFIAGQPQIDAFEARVLSVPNLAA